MVTVYTLKAVQRLALSVVDSKTLPCLPNTPFAILNSCQLATTHEQIVAHLTIIESTTVSVSSYLTPAFAIVERADPERLVIRPSRSVHIDAHPTSKHMGTTMPPATEPRNTDSLQVRNDQSWLMDQISSATRVLEPELSPGQLRFVEQIWDVKGRLLELERSKEIATTPDEPHSTDSQWPQPAEKPVEEDDDEALRKHAPRSRHLELRALQPELGSDQLRLIDRIWDMKCRLMELEGSKKTATTLGKPLSIDVQVLQVSQLVEEPFEEEDDEALQKHTSEASPLVPLDGARSRLSSWSKVKG